MFAARKTDNVSSAANYIEDVFSTYLYDGTGSSQTITNNIDTTTYGGLVWIKGRSGATGHRLTDTARGATKSIACNDTNAEATESTGLTAFGTTGFTIGADADYNTSAATYASWTFRKQAKFFDIVTWTGDGTNPRTINHNLGSTPGCIIIKCTSSGVADWPVWHRSLSTQGGFLNTVDNFSSGFSYFGSTVTSTTFSLNSANVRVNQSSATYVAYLFAHDAGGFGAAGTDNVISCGSYTGNGSATGPTVSLGYEPQLVLIKNASFSSTNWLMFDSMRGVAVGGNDARLSPNTSGAENTSLNDLQFNASGFQLTTVADAVNRSGDTFVYIAIRRGPMKTPTSGTSVFNPNAYTATGVGNRNFTDVGFSPDWSIFFDRSNSQGNSGKNLTRLVSPGIALQTTSTNAEQTGFADYFFSGYNNLGYQFGSLTGGSGQLNGPNGATKVFWNFGRAPGFFDVVCYTGTGSATTQTHNLGAAPELLIVKSRDTAVNWVVWASAPTPQQNQYALNLNTAGTWGGVLGDKIWGATLTGAPNMTSTTFSLGDYVGVNGSAKTYVAYLFATVTGVSKVGSYTGTGALQTINCGFASGARFVLIKRTDSTGDWWVYDSARGISSGNDPYLFLNSTAAEVTTTNYVDTDSTGFKVTAAAPAAINANGGTFIFLAIA